MITFPNAKINLGLHVVNKRVDGFHTIESVFYPIPLFDMLEVVELTDWQENQPKWQFHTDGIHIAGDPDQNLIIKAYRALDELFHLPPVSIILYKKIPMGAGLGGGSADASFMLKLLNDKFNLNQTNETLKEIASKLGSDCAFFIDNNPAYLLGKGHELTPFSINLAGTWLVLLTPNVHSSTQLAYSKVVPRGETSVSLQALLQQPISHWRDAVVNDFEQSVFQAYPELDVYKKQLYEQGAVYASMSGSGSAIFGLFTSEPTLSKELMEMCACKAQL